MRKWPQFRSVNIIFSMLLCCNFVPMWNKCGNQDLLTRCELSVDNRPVTFWLPELLQYVDGLSSIMCAFDAQCKKCVQESVVKGMWDRWVMDYVKHGSFCIVWSVEWQSTGCISELELLQCANGLLSSVLFMFFFSIVEFCEFLPMCKECRRPGQWITKTRILYMV